MPQFEYLVKNVQGQDETGVEEATDTDALVQSLRRQGYLIVRINEVKKRKFLSIALGIGKSGGKAGRIKIDDLVILSRQLATLVGAGVPLLQSLEVLGEQTEKAQLKNVIKVIHDDVQSGKSFSEGLEKHPNVFPFLFIHMVRAGETSGHLEEILDRLATYMEKTSALQKKIHSALTYPAVVSAMAILITVGMLTFIIPKFADIFLSLNAPLPTPTLLLIGLSKFVRSNILLLVGLTIVAFFGFFQWKKTKGGRFLWDGLKLKMPVFGPLFLKVAVSKFSRTLATLVKSGVPILTSLEVVAATSGNAQLERLILSLRTSVSKGESLSGPLSKSPLLPPMVVRMIAVGEETGELETMLIKIADFYDTQVDSTVASLTSLIEPLVIAFLGIVIGGIVIAMFLPILTLTQAIK
ncbi:MAG: type II secretion system F family protein [Candidatus Omnitrophica bacterium]|nr:type II secretion system F family protein [Candidatus Omnitrophota bacterium]